MRMPGLAAIRWIVITAFSLGIFAMLEETSLAEPTPANAKTGLIPRKVLFGNPDKAGPQISPDGKHLSFLAPVDGVLNVWVAPIDKPDQGQAGHQGQETRHPRLFLGLYEQAHPLHRRTPTATKTGTSTASISTAARPRT